jgi:hypothetical protein
MLSGERFAAKALFEGAKHTTTQEIRQLLFTIQPQGWVTLTALSEATAIKHLLGQMKRRL